jgi:hypothetical protein
MDLDQRGRDPLGGRAQERRIDDVPHERTHMRLRRLRGARHLTLLTLLAANALLIGMAGSSAAAPVCTDASGVRSCVFSLTGEESYVVPTAAPSLTAPRARARP